MELLQFQKNNKEIEALLQSWIPVLLNLKPSHFNHFRNIQQRNMKQIVGHMVDSVSNNTHRIIHLQYQKSPLIFPNYATNGNNDRWIAIQNYENENWENLVNLWKYAHLHFIHVVNNVNPNMLEQEWNGGTDETVTLNEMILDFLRHFKLHIGELEELLRS